MFRIFILVLSIIEVVLKDSLSFPLSENEANIEKHEIYSSQYSYSAPKFVVSIGIKTANKKMFVQYFLGNMISKKTAVTYIPRIFLDTFGHQHWYVNTQRKVDKSLDLHLIRKFGNFDKHVVGTEEYYTYVELKEVLTSLSQFPVCAHERINLADKMVFWNKFYSHYDSTNLFIMIKIYKVSNSKCNLTDTSDQICIRSASKDYRINKKLRGSAVFHEGKLVGIVTKWISSIGVVGTIAKLGIKCED